MILCIHNEIPAERKLLSTDGSFSFSGSIQEAPVFEYMYNGIQYHEQTTQNISYKLLTQNMRDGETYSIYVDPKHPAVFILQKKIKVSSIITVVFGIMFFSSGIATLCAIFPIFWSVIK